MMDKLDVIKLTKAMVAMNTVSSLSNLQLVEFIKKLLESLGFVVMLQANKSGDKANLIGSIGPKNVEPLMFSAHMDTVPLGELHCWETKPLVLTEKRKKLYGRGTVDMKGAIAAILCAVQPLAKLKLKRELIIGLTYDEEIGLVGAKQLVDSGIVQPAFALIAEPTMMKPMRIHKGHIYLQASCQGTGGHASDPASGINAIKVAAEAVRIIDEFANELKGYKCKETNPPYATINIGVIKGGEKANIIPESCKVEFDIRPIPGQKSKSLINDLCARLEAIGICDGQPMASLKMTRIPTEPVSTSPDSEIVKTAEQITKESAQGVSYGTDGSMLQKLGTDCLIMGPGSIDQAHKPNEFVAVHQLNLAVEQFEKIARQMCLR